jgi:hypothetical protein
MTFSVDKDVTVVPVLDLKQVRDDGIACDIASASTSVSASAQQCFLGQQRSG